MTRRHVLTGLLLICLVPAAALAAESSATLPAVTPSHAHEIENLELQYLTSTSREQRKYFVSELKTLAKGFSAEDAEALNVSVSAMLPAADSAEEAEVLLDIAAAHPAGQLAGERGFPGDAEFLVDARRAAVAAKHAKGDIEVLADIRIDHLRKDSQGHDGLTATHVQELWRINTIQGAKSFSPHPVMYAGMSERLCMVRARVLKSDGSEMEATASADQPVIERVSSMYFDSRARDLRFPQLTPGDLVEIEYQLLPAVELNAWAGYYARMNLFRDVLPTRLRRQVVIAPTSMRLYAVERGLGPAVVRQTGEETTRIWEMRDIGAQPLEALSPGASEEGPYLHLSTIGSMEEFGRWYSSLLEGGLMLDENLRLRAQQILERNLTDRDKVQAVYESVQRSTGYIALEFGVHSYRPYPVATVERRGFGDCKDKAAMIVALLRAVGVPAEFAMVRTRSAGNVAAEAYSVQLFNHAMAYVPEFNLYLDGTAEYATLGELPPDDQGAVVITVDASGKATRRTVPFSPPEANCISREVKAQVGRDGRVEFSARTGYAGYFAAEQRRSGQSDNLAGSYRATLAQFYRSVRIAHAVAEGTARGSREVELKIEGSIDAAHGEREATLRSSLNSAGLTRRYAPEQTRRNPVLVPVTPSQREVFEYELPEGSEALLPADIKLSTAFGKVEVSYQRQGRNLRVETYTELLPLTVATADYAAFRSFCRAADEALQREVRIVLP
jgi:transglutaminase-like putative cysteine protease